MSEFITNVSDASFDQDVIQAEVGSGRLLG